MSKDFKVWGIGLGRTGTKSLTKGLKVLGYNIAHNPAYVDDFSREGIDGTAEGTTAFHYEYLDVRFPNSKFILTTRHIDDWLASTKRAIEEIYPKSRIPDSSPFYNPMIRNRASRWGCTEYDRDTLICKYYNHHNNIINHFKNRPNDLIIIDITRGCGWEKICEHLGEPIPECPFPHVMD